MDVLIKNLEYVIILAAICSFFWIFMAFLKGKKVSSKQSDFKKVEAKMAVLRLTLKAKVKRQVNFYRSGFLKIEEGDRLDISLKKLEELNFDSSESFDSYFEIFQNINSYVTAKPESADHQRTEATITKLMLELVEQSKELHSKKSQYNRSFPKKSVLVEQPLKFSALEKLTRPEKTESPAV